MYLMRQRLLGLVALCSRTRCSRPERVARCSLVLSSTTVMPVGMARRLSKTWRTSYLDERVMMRARGRLFTCCPTLFI